MSEQLSLYPDEKLLIISDIHNKYRKAEEIIRKEDPDKILFLGDYFDDFGDTVKDADDTSRWLADSLECKNRTHLIGNHDLNYMTDNPKLKCTGYAPDKHEAIRNNMVPWDKMHLFCQVDDWLCTHAGLALEFYMQYKDTDSVWEFLEKSKYDLKKIDDVSHPAIFFQIGSSRGGTSLAGGILWCDYGEFVDIPGIKQIFGHTRDNSVRHKKTADSEHYCIDTILNHYAVYENHMMQIRPA